jgi:hypothetical protein
MPALKAELGKLVPHQSCEYSFMGATIFGAITRQLYLIFLLASRTVILFSERPIDIDSYRHDF